MSEIEEALTKKIGPAPGYVWVGLAVGGFVIWRKLKGGSSSAAAVPAGTTDTSIGSSPGTIDTGTTAPAAPDPTLAAIEQELQQLLGLYSQRPNAPRSNSNAPPSPAHSSPAAQQTDTHGNPLTGGPVFAYSDGQLVGYAPHASNVFSTSTPAEQGYEALGLHASDPYTLLPGVQNPANAAPPSPTIPIPGQLVPV